MQSQVERTTRASLLLAVRDLHDEIAWREFLAFYQPLLETWYRQNGARFYLQEDDFQDVLQRVRIKLLKAMPRFDYDPDRGFRSYLKRMVNNEVVNLLRERNRRPGNWGSGDSDVLEQLINHPDDSLGDTLAEWMAPELEKAREVIERVKARVKPHVWHAFWLTTYEELSFEEAAKKLNVRVAIVYAYRSRVRKMLEKAAADCVRK